MSDAHERIVHVLDISTVTVTDIRSTTNSIQAGLITVRHTTRVGRIKGPSIGARALLRSDTLSTATPAAADRLTDSQDILREPLLAGADIGTDAISVLTSIAADRKALLVRRVRVTLIAETLFGSHANTIQATLRALGHAELSSTIQFVSRLANALVTITTGAIIATNGTGGHTLSQGVQNVIRVTGAQVGSHTQSVNAFLLADRVTLAEVVRVLLVTIAAQVNDTEGRVGLNRGRMD